ncbi:ABC transporter permease subunit [archaeon]|nr:ABC transporter permease subunit [archaeon]
MRQTGVIFSHEFKQAFKSWKVLLIIILYIALLFGCLFMFDFAEDKINDMREQQSYGRAGDVDLYRDVEREFGSLGFIIPLLVSLVLIPFAVLFMTFYAVSSERNFNSIRYLASRVNRFSIIFGKLLSYIVVMLISVLIFYALGSLYVHFKMGDTIVFQQFLYSFVFLTIYSMALISLIIFISSLVKKPFSSLGWGLIGFVIMYVLMFIWELKWISIFYYIREPLAGFSSTAAINMLAFLIFTIVFLGLTYWKIGRTDL